MLTKIMHAHVWTIFLGYFENYLHAIQFKNQIIIWRKIHHYLGLQYRYRLYTQDVETLQWLVRQLIFVEKETKSWLSHNTSIILNEEKGNA